MLSENKFTIRALGVEPFFICAGSSSLDLKQESSARISGTCDMLDYKINLHGRLRVDTRISKTTSGVKSPLLKFIDPIFKRNKKS